MSFVTISSQSDFLSLFEKKWNLPKYIYTRNSDFFKEGSALCRLNQKQAVIDIDDESLLHSTVPEFRCGEHGCQDEFNSIHSYEIHYRTFHSNSCLECKRCFPTAELLDHHIQEKHDSYAKAIETKGVNIYQCLLPSCTEAFQSVEDHKEHMIKMHKYPGNFKYIDARRKQNVDKMDTSGSASLGNSSVRSTKSVPKVPHSICFGHSAMRGFRHTKKSFKKTSSDITMKELQDALDHDK